ncbi:PfkB family carbohydrate kinase [Thermococcus thioreducens]|uniref:Carbohydrate kinase n=2 Tax=Thermococcus thioreducens TaxID=277988 RepID=A0A1I0M0K0_9EURY|nr:carbohydrate kinase [Thermococcus thioreducens]ASJ13049.1 carbohydrate kinase [Thermococcus thioreducens]SEV81879.1 Fructose-1-phosphate kinase or kinase (PfkB) [Thermococcus thioreducens]
MKCLLVGHLVIDTIVGGSKSETRIGGGAYYSAITLSNFCDVEVLTSVGEDFPDEWLDELRAVGIKLRIIPSEKSTAYELRYLDVNWRELRLLSKAAPISKAPVKRYDMVLLNPVANEIPPELVEKLKKKAVFLAADVQGFIRAPVPGNVMLQRTDVSFLKGLKAVHADISEMDYLKNLRPGEVEVFLASNGPETGFAYFRGSRYAYRPVRVEVKESTGAGDVFLASFSYFYTRCPFVQALKRANTFTALFLKHRSFSFSMEEVNELAMKVSVKKLNDINPRG